MIRKWHIIGDLLYRASKKLGKNAHEADILEKAFFISQGEKKALGAEVSLPEIDSIYWASFSATLNNTAEMKKIISAMDNSIKGKCCNGKNE
ncbi:hypothetical protein [Candidatus Uabimicrobium sp. HlEnr_7]|uniref:hypothetical protein n=1 Tax=Candidatus Uabimicrobium helgolandensis TaxID=3095367 RepID=UPI003556EA7E